MWNALKQIARLPNQCTAFNNVLCNGIRPKMHSTLIQQNLLSSQTTELQAERVKLNSLKDGTPYALTKEQREYVGEGTDGGVEKWMALELELYIKREKGYLLPETISLDDLKIMMNLSSLRRKKYLKYLWGKEKYNKERELEKLNKEPHEFAPSTSEFPWLDYRMHENALFSRILKQEMNTIYNSSAMRGLQFGQKIVIDCSYNSFMDDIALKQAAKQILSCFYATRKHRRSFALHFCNLDFDSRLMHYFQKMHPGIETTATLGLHAESYLDVFEREKLVYLSPHSDNTLQYNPKDTYILGGYVDTNHPVRPLSIRKAMSEKIRHAKLPLDKFLKWDKGTKSLCVNHVFNILMDVKNTGDWARALKKHVPLRKIQERPARKKH